MRVCRSILGMATIGHMMSQIMKSRVKTTDPVKLVTYKQFCAVGLDTSLGHVSKLLDMDHFVLVVHNQRMGMCGAVCCSCQSIRPIDVILFATIRLYVKKRLRLVFCTLSQYVDYIEPHVPVD